MSETLAALGRKTLGLALIFNSIISLTSATNILASFYINMPMWQPYSPYLINGSFFWFVLLVAGLNIFSAKLIGRAKIKRILFHHYVYGLLVSSIAIISVAFLAPAYISLLLTPSTGFQADGFQNVSVYAGLFFVYGGLTLVIDDAYDISLRAGRTLDKMKMRIRRLDKALQTTHLLSSLMSLYVTLSILLWYLENRSHIMNWPLMDISYVVFIPSMFITSIWGLKAFKGKLWYRIFSEPHGKDFSISMHACMLVGIGYLCLSCFSNNIGCSWQCPILCGGNVCLCDA